MDIKYLRSSSQNTWEDYCQQKYYLTYVLGMEDFPNLKAEKGTCVHAVLEILAGMKKSFQDSGKYEYNHPGIGSCTSSKKEFLKPYTLTNDEVRKINISRKNKYTYKDQKYIEKPYTRYGVDLVTELIDRCYKYYSEKSPNEWTNIEYRDIVNFTWMELDWGNGAYDPRKRNVIYPELPFNIPIEKEWAKIDNDYLRIKGTIDLVTEVDIGVIECVDYKTGQRYNWGKGKTKEIEDLLDDTQLMLYYYALRQVLKEYNSILFTIFFLRDGGPFTLPFDDDSVLEEIEKRIRKTFEDIKDCKQPKLLDPKHRDFRCEKLCTFYKEKIDDMCVCDYIKNEVEVYGITEATRRNRVKGFQVDNYKNPGE